MRAVSVPLSHLLRMSRQLSEEYRERAGSDLFLYLSDHVAFEISCPELSPCVLDSARNIRTMSIRLASFSGEQLSDELELLEQWVNVAVHALSGLEALDLRIDVTTTEDAVGATHILSEPGWTNLPHLRHIEIWLREATDAEPDEKGSEGYALCDKLLLQDSQKHRLFAIRSSSQKAFHIASASAPN
ncbi:hypothetical protein CERZMDRAFT_80295 [Cercospora zeae-maydis SCOH1-5]|uniref:Uncharacterized protein n=1 Tax=Cercospora zeae-maydis SCOH1-5 TaxID=717836 RepID=A0A6A6FW04_9PEZI|nr:hypothetical protein CERZMDRAFT_80295 [Cercospora zeae-maydis SCOH1-5]